MKQGMGSVQELLEAIQHQADNKVDYTSHSANIDVVANGDLKLKLRGIEEEDLLLPMQDIASRQLGEKIGIPAKYFDRMLKDAPDLLAHNANHWLQQEPKQMMIRTMFGKARAVLSNKYQRIDNIDLAEQILPMMRDELKDLKIASTEITEKRLYIKAVMPSLCRDIKVGDTVEAGVWISNSEIGFGQFEVAPFIHRLICLNGQKVNDAKFSRRHVGARADVNDYTYSVLSDETLKADDKAFMLKARDIVKAAFEEKVFERNVNQLRETTERKIEGDPVKAVAVLGKTTGLLEQEQSGILRKLIEGADLSQFGMVQAVTAYSQDVESYDRASELEELGGKLVTLKPHEWQPIAAAA